MKIITIACTAIFLWSCSGGQPINGMKQPGSNAAPENISAPTEAVAASGMHSYGYYVGEFVAVGFNEQKKNAVYKNKINISVDSLFDGKVYGHSVVAGNSRPFSGSYHSSAAGFKVVAGEPGTDKYDGTFDFELDTANARLSGTWTSFRTDLDVREREYILEHREFKYDPANALPPDLSASLELDLSKYKAMDEGESVEMITEDASKLNPSVVKLKKSDVENMYKGDLEVMRNSIYAKHGYSFKNRRMRFIFDADVDWYIPVTTDVRNVLTPLEKENIELIKRYEDHAEKYYDNFGR